MPAPDGAGGDPGQRQRTVLAVRKAPTDGHDARIVRVVEQRVDVRRRTHTMRPGAEAHEQPAADLDVRAPHPTGDDRPRNGGGLHGVQARQRLAGQPRHLDRRERGVGGRVPAARLRQILQRVRQPRPAGVAPPVRRAIECLDGGLPTRRDAGLGDEDHRTLYLLGRIGVDRQGGPELDRARAQLPGQLAERQDGEHRVFARRCRCAGAARVREIVGNEEAHDHVVVVHVRSGLGRAPKRERDTAIGAISRPREHRLAHPCLERGVGDGSWVPDLREGRRPAGARALVHEHRAHDVPAQAHRRTRAAPVLDPNVRGERGRGVATGDDHGARLVLADREGLRDLGLALRSLDDAAIG